MRSAHEQVAAIAEDLIAMKERAAQVPGRRPSEALLCDQADVELRRGETPDPDEGW